MNNREIGFSVTGVGVSQEHFRLIEEKFPWFKSYIQLQQEVSLFAHEACNLMEVDSLKFFEGEEKQALSPREKKAQYKEHLNKFMNKGRKWR